MKHVILLFNILLCLVSSAQNNAYYLSGQMNIKRVDLDSKKLIAYYDFLDTTVIRRTAGFSAYSAVNDEFFHSDTINVNESFFRRGSPFGDGLYNSAIVDSFNVNEKWYKIEIIQTDDHFVGGSPNRVTTDITLGDLGVIYSSSNWIGEHLDIMICHQDSIKQNLLTGAFKYIKINYPDVIYEEKLERIITLTQNYNFNNLIDILSEKWLAPRHDLKLIETNSTIINGQINYAVTIRNISNIGYYFLAQSEFGPAAVEYRRNDESVTGSIDGNSHGTRYHYNFKKTSEPIYLDPGEEISFNILPNWRENCGSCNQNKYYGFQVYRYGVDFFSWVFSNDIVFDNKNYTLYHLNEID